MGGLSAAEGIDFFRTILERQAKGHLNLPRRPDRFIGQAQTARGWGNVDRLAHPGKSVKVNILAHIVDGDIKARSVGKVEDVESILQGIPLSNR